jgi:O-antigen/teichoic acid export membrane protein
VNFKPLFWTVEKMSEPEFTVGNDLEGAQNNKRGPGFIYAVVGQGLFSLTRLATSMLIGGRFSSGAAGTGSEEELGVYLAYFSILLLCVSFLEAFVTTPMTYLLHAKQGVEKKRFSSFLLIVCGCMAVAVSAICLAAGFVLRYWQDSILPETVVAFCFLIATQFVREFLVRWILAQLDSKRYALIEMLYFAFYLPSLAAMLYFESLSIATLFVCMAVINIVIILVWWFWYRLEFFNPFSSQNSVGVEASQRFGSTLREQIVYGRWIAADSFCSLCTVYFCNWFLLFKIGASGAGVYGACMTVVMLVNPFLNGVMSVFAPVSAIAFEENGKPALTHVMLKYGLPLLAIMVVFSASLYFLGDWLTVKFFGDRYSDYFATNYGGKNQITFFIGLSMPLTTIAYVLACGVMASGNPKYTFISSAIGFASILILCGSLQTPNLEQCAICFSASVGIMAVARLYFYLNNCSDKRS